MDQLQGAQTVPINETPSITSKWFVFGQKFPRQEVVYFSQTILIYIIIIACLLNLSLGTSDSNLWVALLGSCFGYLMPNPSMQDGAFLRNPPQQQL